MLDSDDPAVYAFFGAGSGFLKVNQVNQKDVEKRAVLFADVDNPVHDSAQAFFGTQAFVCEDFHEFPFKLACHLLDAPGEDFLFVLEVDVERGSGDSACVCDFLEGYVIVAFAGEQLQRFFENLMLSFVMLNDYRHSFLPRLELNLLRDGFRFQSLLSPPFPSERLFFAFSVPLYM